VSLAQQRFDSAQKKLEQLQKEFADLLAYFGEDKMESDEFFGFIFNFVFNFEVPFIPYLESFIFELFLVSMRV
jgi:hypothetical protein